MNIFILMTNDDVWCVKRSIKEIGKVIEACGVSSIRIEENDEVKEYSMSEGLKELQVECNMQVVNEELLERGDEYVDMRIINEKV